MAVSKWVGGEDRLSTNTEARGSFNDCIGATSAQIKVKWSSTILQIKVPGELILR